MPCAATGRLLRGLAAGLAGLAGVAGQEQWAVLVAGSKGYFNYRHQADVCHSYKVLIERGFDPDKIITLIYDDVANSTMNPYPGRLYNHPAESMDEAVDVYAGCKKDYTGETITPETFLAVLSGDAKTAGGKVLRSTAKDHVFINFVDHGGVGLIGFPSFGNVLHAKPLVDTLKLMHATGMYEQLVFYLETCESGSMFEGLLPRGLPVYAVTAANAVESSWGTYCGEDAKVGGKYLNTCLGDLFEVNWMADSEGHQVKETLGQQFSRVKSATDLSHVMHYGQVSTFSREPVSQFQGAGGEAPRLAVSKEVAPHPGSLVSARDVKVRLLLQEYLRTGSAEARKQLLKEEQDREAVRALGDAIAKKVVGSGEKARALLGAPIAADGVFSWTPSLVACHERIVEAFGSLCGWTENRLVLAKILFQLCEHESGDVRPVLAAVGGACKAAPEPNVNLVV